MPSTLRIALLGARHTGKTTLAQGITAHFQAQGHTHLQVADGTPLLTAARQQQHNGDTTLYPAANTQQHSYHLTLLCGLDLPWLNASGQPHAEEPLRAELDHLLRHALHTAGIPYRIIYGHGSTRLDNALHAIHSTPEYPAWAGHPTTTRPDTLRSRPWACGKCSDADCEHQLFTGLLKP